MNNPLSVYPGIPVKDGVVLTELYSGQLREEIESDNIIPDSVPDVERVLLCTATPRIEGQFVGDEAIEMEGSICYEVLLQTEGEELASLTFTEPFTLKQPCRIPGADAQLLAVPGLHSVSARLINPRKIHLHSQVDIPCRLWGPVTPRPQVSGADTLADDMALQRQYTDVLTAEMSTVTEQEIPVSLDVELDSNLPPAAEILYHRVSLCPNEVRLREGAADVRSEASLSLLYRTEEGNCFATEKRLTLDKTLSLPFSDGVEWIASAEIGTVSAAIRANSYGEMKIIELDFPYALTLTAIRNTTVGAVTDMFSTDYETDAVTATVPVTRLHRQYGTNLSLNSSCSRESVNAESVRGILTGFATLSDLTATFQPEKRRLVIDGTAQIALIGENNAVDGSQPHYTPVAFTHPVRCELDAGEGFPEGECLVQGDVLTAKFRCDSQNLYADLELALHVLAIETRDLSYVESLTLDTDRPVESLGAPIVLCYPAADETLWDVAKHYKVTEESLRQANGITEGTGTSRKVLIVPKGESRRTIASRIL